VASLRALGAVADFPTHIENRGQKPASETQWIEAARRGDPAGFACLVCKYQQKLCGALLDICGSQHEAEDVTQEAFVQAHCKLENFAGGSAFYTWLYRIAMNIAITRHRRRKKESSLDQSRQRTGDEPHDDGERAEEKLLREERAQHVRLALEQLNSEHRKILVLREIEGCDYQTISKMLELPIGTVRSRLNRARLQLRDKLVIVLEGANKSLAAPRMLAGPPSAEGTWWVSN
jgi:RNA polymerase sigma-70 factor (ECF subfamily)